MVKTGLAKGSSGVRPDSGFAEAFGYGEFLRLRIGGERRGRLHEQPFLFGDNCESFSAVGQGKNSPGKIVGIHVGCGQGPAADQQVADFFLGDLGRLGVGKSLRAILIIKSRQLGLQNWSSPIPPSTEQDNW